MNARMPVSKIHTHFKLDEMCCYVVILDADSEFDSRLKPYTTTQNRDEVAQLTQINTSVLPCHICDLSGVRDHLTSAEVQ